MGLYNFQKQFAPHALSGQKQFTIRKIRKNAGGPGDTLHLYSNLYRDPQCLGRVSCTQRQDVTIYADGITLDGARISRAECDEIARADGFKDFTRLVDYFKNDLPFRGHLFRWRHLGKPRRCSGRVQ